jgi:hypothetical protein
MYPARNRLAKPRKFKISILSPTGNPLNRSALSGFWGAFIGSGISALLYIEGTQQKLKSP